MPRGKKFNAAEKHFIEKEQRYQKQIRYLKEVIAAQELEIARLKAAVDDRDNQILSQKDWINRLLEYTELSKEDIKTVCAADKVKADRLSAINRFADSFGRFYI